MAGRGISWFGYIPDIASLWSSSATYSIDSGSPTSVELKGPSPEASTNALNQEFFSTSQLPLGQHTLVVSYNGSRDQAPLTLSHFIVTTSDVSPANPASSSSIQASTTPSSNTQGPNGAHPQVQIGAIVGGVIGGVVLTALASLCFFFWRRKKRAQSMLPVPGLPPSPGPRSAIMPFVPDVEEALQRASLPAGSSSGGDRDSHPLTASDHPPAYQKSPPQFPLPTIGNSRN